MTKNTKSLLWPLFFLFCFVLIINAWICDDSYITMRTVDNFINGHGLVWNVGERVQSYTHPLWMFLVSIFYAITKEAYFTLLALSAAISLLVVYLFSFKVAKNVYIAALGLIAFVASKAFIDYSTSGLENPLSNLLILVFFVISLGPKQHKNKLVYQSLAASLLMLNRLDLALIVLPVLIYDFCTDKSELAAKLKQIMIGFSPLIAWEFFSLVYYGFLFPNTAYAKLGNGFEGARLAGQGFKYLLNSIAVDPVTLLVIVAAIIAAAKSKSPKIRWSAVGIILYLTYTVKIGGDFMSGRFLVALFMSSLCILVYSEVYEKRAILSLGAMIILLAFLSPYSPIKSSSDYPPKQIEGKWGDYGVSDERGFYYPVAGLLRINNDHILPQSPWVDNARLARAKAKKVSIKGNIGFFGYYIGPNKYVVDPYGLSDPLLARLPAKKTDKILIGHFLRGVPCGYLASIETSENRLCNPDLAIYFDKIKVITQGPIFTFNRFKKIVAMNFGHYNKYLDKYINSAYPDGDGVEGSWNWD